MTYRKSYVGFSENPLLDPWNPRWLRSAILKIDTTSAEGGPIWIKFRRLVQNDMLTAVIWSKSKPDVEFQYGGRLGEFHGMPCHSHLPHCRVLPPGEFNVMIPELRVTLQGAVTWRNLCHDRVTLQGVRIPSAILKIVFRYILFFVLMQFRLWRAAAFVSFPIQLFTMFQDLLTVIQVFDKFLTVSELHWRRH